MPLNGKRGKSFYLRIKDLSLPHFVHFITYLLTYNIHLFISYSWKGNVKPKSGWFFKEFELLLLQSFKALGRVNDQLTCGLMFSIFPFSKRTKVAIVRVLLTGIFFACCVSNLGSSFLYEDVFFGDFSPGCVMSLSILAGLSFLCLF